MHTMQTAGGLPATNLRLALAIAALFTLLACSTANQGRLISSSEVYGKFVAYEVREGYTYFFRGQVNRPQALLGLKPGISIQSDLWQPIDFSNHSFQVMVDRTGIDSNRRIGYNLLDPEGNRIGIYFAPGGGATIRMASATEIAWITPVDQRIERRRGFDD